MSVNKHIKPFPLAPDYLVTDKGNIYSNKGRVTKPIKVYTKARYSQVNIVLNGKPKTLRVHRIVAITFLKKLKGKEFVNHKDGNRYNNHVENLEWCTREENLAHAMENNLLATGIDVATAILSEGDVNWLRGRKWRQGDVKKLAQFFGVALVTLREARDGKTWGHLQ